MPITTIKVAKFVPEVFGSQNYYLLGKLKQIACLTAAKQNVKLPGNSKGDEYMNYHLDPYFLLSHHALMSQIGFYSYACIWDDVEETQCRFILVSSPKGHQCHVPDNLILPYLEESNIHWDIENEEFVFDL